jgi:hypothetical protein
MLNPDGFRHSPGSRDGCVLLVRLRQFGGAGRPQRRIFTPDLPWRPTSAPGISAKELFSDPRFDDSMRLERWEKGTRVATDVLAKQREYFVIRGDLTADGHTPLRKHSYLKLSTGDAVTLETKDGCELYIRDGDWRA